MKKILFIIVVSLIGFLFWKHSDKKELMPAIAGTVPSTEDFAVTEIKTMETEATSSSEEIIAIENPDNLPVLTGTETTEGLYWDPVWHHETYLEIAPDIKVWFDEAGNKYFYPVDATGNPIQE